MRANLKVLFSVFLIVIFAALCGRALRAVANGPSKAVLDATEVIKDSTPKVWKLDEEIKPLKDERAALEADIIKAYETIEKECWSYDFNTDALIPCDTKSEDGLHSAANDNYKTDRLQEMAEAWKGTSLEPHTVMLLSMLLQEDGTLTAERRHDCTKGVCYAIGFQGHHICYRGTPLVSQNAGKPFKTFCTWKNGKSPQEQFEKEYPGFSFDWRIQFAEYTLRMTQCIDAGKSVNQCIQAWNSREVGRIDKVKRHSSLVKAAIL